MKQIQVVLLLIVQSTDLWTVLILGIVFDFLLLLFIMKAYKEIVKREERGDTKLSKELIIAAIIVGAITLALMLTVNVGLG